MRRSLVMAVILMAALCTACGARKGRTVLRPEDMGTYRFAEQLSPDDRIRGHFVVAQDTVAIEATPGPCRYEPDKSTALVIAYICGDVLFTFDRASPVRKARYSVTLHLRELRTVCARYGKNRSGQTVCEAYTREPVFRDVRRSGLLRVERVGDVM